MENHKAPRFFIDYGARFAESRSSCLVMQEIKRQANIDNQSNSSVQLRNYILNNGTQLAENQRQLFDSRRL